MGGSVKVIIRKEDGTINAMTRWTNSLSWLLHTPDCFISTENDAFNRYMRSFNDMKADYDKHKHDGQFELNMTDVYFYEGCDTLAPVEYGIVVMDYKTKTLISSQGYTGPKAYMFTRKIITDDKQVVYLPDCSFGTYDEDELKYHLSKGDILSFNYRLSRKQNETTVSLLGVTTIEQFSNKINAFFQSLTQEFDLDEEFDGGMLELTFNRHGFNVFFYDDVLEAKAKMEEIGFVIPEKDLEQWNPEDDEEL